MQHIINKLILVNQFVLVDDVVFIIKSFVIQSYIVHIETKELSDIIIGHSSFRTIQLLKKYKEHIIIININNIINRDFLLKVALDIMDYSIHYNIIPISYYNNNLCVDSKSLRQHI